MLADGLCQVRRGIPLQQGSALLEGLIAIVIFSMGVLALVSLQANSMKATTASKARVDASMVANQRIAAMWADRNSLASYVETNTSLASSVGLPSGKRTTAVNGSLVTVTVTWRMPNDSSDNTYTATSNVVGNN